VLTSNGASDPTWEPNANGVAIVDDTTTNATRYLTFTSATTGNITTENVSSTKLQFNPSTGVLSSTSFTGAATGLTGTASININGTVGATTAATGSFTTLNTSGQVVFNDAGANVDFRVEGDTNNNLLFVDASADAVGIGTNAPAVLAHVQSTTATTNAVTQVLRLDSQSSGTPANGIGVGMQFSTETAAGNTEIGATIEAITTDVTATSEDFDLSFKTMAAGAAAAERARIKSTGDFQFNSGFGSVATAYGCRAWVNFDGTGTPAIRASGNVSSITDGGTGTYTVNFTTAMPDANYAAFVDMTPSASNAGSDTFPITYQTTSIEVRHFEDNTLRDSVAVNVSVFR
jgi:hypothetical protein